MEDETDYLPAQSVERNCRRIDCWIRLAAVPEEAVWLAKLKSRRTRLAYQRDVQDFMKFVGIRRPKSCAESTIEP